MKIGVMTFWHGNSNYGQIIQCWAMQHYLKHKGHEPYVIRFVPSNYSSPAKRLLKKILCVEQIRSTKEYILNRQLYALKKINKTNDQYRKFDEFRQKYLSFSDCIYHDIYQIRKNPPVADAYIVGSDQVWAQMLNNINNRAFFLDFGNPKIKRIAYAPSFVVKEYPRTLCEELKFLLQRFDAVSTREYSGVDICESIGIKATKVLDPTFLLDRKDYLSLVGESIEKKRKIFIYSLNISSSDQIRWQELNQYAKEEGLEIIVTPAQGYFAASELFGNETEYLYATPQQWLKIIAESELVVTPSFHGVVLSIILETPFVYVPLTGMHESGNARILDLLRDLHLENRILTTAIKYKTIIETHINWNSVYNSLMLYKKSSYEFLQNCGL